MEEEIERKIGTPNQAPQNVKTQLELKLWECLDSRKIDPKNKFPDRCFHWELRAHNGTFWYRISGGIETCAEQAASVGIHDYKIFSDRLNRNIEME